MLSLVTMTSGCYTSAFLPQTHNVPLFTEAHQFRITPSHNIKTVDLSVAYSPTHFLGVMINGQLTPQYEMAEIGLGAFKKLGKKMIGEIYFGCGTGSMKSKYSSRPNWLIYDYDVTDINLSANKYFVQPNLGIKFTDKVDLALSLKCSYWHYPYIDYYREHWEDHGKYQVIDRIDDIHERNATTYTIEPALTFRVGGEHTKFFFQTGLCATPYHQLYLNPYRNTAGYFRLGVSVNFGIGNKKED